MIKKILAALAVTAALVAGYATPAQAALTYFYAGRHQHLSATGLAPVSTLSFNMRVEDQDVTGTDFHSVVQTALRKTYNSNANAIEFGTAVNFGVFGDNDPHLFAVARVNGSTGGWNANCVDDGSNPVNIGANLATLGHTNSAKQFIVQRVAGTNDWGLYYNGSGVCSFPQSMWAGVGGFMGADQTMFFGEVAANTSTPTSEMGDDGGTCGSVGALPAAYFASISYGTTRPTTDVNPANLIETDGTKYDSAWPFPRTIYVGGDGSC